MQRTIPLAIINETRVLGGYYLFETHLVAAQCQALQCPVGSMQHNGTRSLVDLA